VLAIGLLLAPAEARAQFQPRPVPEPPSAETFWVEASTGFWRPGAQMEISSEGLGILGSEIDFKKDLGLTDRQFGEIRLVLRPARKHKFRFEYIPISYSARGASIPRDIVFNGQRFRVNIPVSWTLDWKAYRFSYEYDFIARNWGFAGFILDLKQTDVTATLENPLTLERARAQAPVPAIGGIARVYPAPNFSITGEFTTFRVPSGISENFHANYTDFDIYGTFNFVRNIGAQFGYRTLDLGYLVDEDTGRFTLKGIYFGIVARY
jgi:hypothetical protein